MSIIGLLAPFKKMYLKILFILFVDHWSFQLGYPVKAGLAHEDGYQHNSWLKNELILLGTSKDMLAKIELDIHFFI